MKTASYLVLLLTGSLFFTACKKNEAPKPLPVANNSIFGLWDYIEPAGVLDNVLTQGIELGFQPDSTYVENIGANATVTGRFAIKPTTSLADGSKGPAISFSTANVFNSLPWNASSFITIKNDTLTLKPYGNIPEGMPAVYKFRRVNLECVVIP